MRNIINVLMSQEEIQTVALHPFFSQRRVGSFDKLYMVIVCYRPNNARTVTKQKLPL
jgi:hypothetical protein